MTQKTIKKLEQLIDDSTEYMTEVKAAETDRRKMHELRKGGYSSYTSSVIHFLTLILQKDSPYLDEYNKHATTYNSKCVQNGIDILGRILQDAQDGWLLNMKGLISAEIFSDFLEMATHLLDENYKDPAAVIIGSVLEEHLRNLCLKNGLPITFVDGKGKTVSKKASVMNDDLARAGTYKMLELKSVTAWLDLRNNAAHGKYNEYDINHVRSMLQGVNDFIVRNSL